MVQVRHARKKTGLVEENQKKQKDDYLSWIFTWNEEKEEKKKQGRPFI